MNKTIRRITAAGLSCVMAASMTMTASMAMPAGARTVKRSRNCSCGKLTATLNNTLTTATATTSITIGDRGVTASVVGKYYDPVAKETKTIGNGNSWTAGVTVSIDNKGYGWSELSSTHTGCCETLYFNIQ